MCTICGHQKDVIGFGILLNKKLVNFIIKKLFWRFYTCIRLLVLNPPSQEGTSHNNYSYATYSPPLKKRSKHICNLSKKSIAIYHQQIIKTSVKLTMNIYPKHQHNLSNIKCKLKLSNTTSQIISVACLDWIVKLEATVIKVEVWCGSFEVSQLNSHISISTSYIYVKIYHFHPLTSHRSSYNALMSCTICIF